MSCCGRIHVKVTFLALSSMDIAWSWVSERNAVCDYKRLAMLLRCELPNKSNQYILWSWFQLTNRSILVWVFLFLSICVQIDCYNYNATSRLTTRYKLSIWMYRFNTFIQNNLGTSNNPSNNTADCSRKTLTTTHRAYSSFIGCTWWWPVNVGCVHFESNEWTKSSRICTWKSMFDLDPWRFFLFRLTFSATSRLPLSFELSGVLKREL